MSFHVRILLSLVLVVVVGMLPATASAELELVPTTPSGGLLEGIRVEAGNFLTANDGLEYVTLVNDGGTFRLKVYRPGTAAPVGDQLVGTATPRFMIVGDCNLDGVDDVLVTVPGFGFEVFESDGIGGFSRKGQLQPQIIDGSGNPRDATIGAISWINIDNDGFPDLAMGFDASSTDLNFNQMWFSPGMVGTTNRGCDYTQNAFAFGTPAQNYGGFAEWGPDNFGNVTAMHTFDFNRDGFDDLALATENFLYVYAGLSDREKDDSSGWFIQRVIHGGGGPPQYAYYALGSADINRDGWLDVVGLTHRNNDPSQGQAYFHLADDFDFFNTGTPPVRLDPSNFWMTDTVAREMKVRTADLDLDGWVDIVSSGLVADMSVYRFFRVHYHTGLSTTPNAFRVPNGEQYIAPDSNDARAVELFDFDQDGDLDLLLEGWRYLPTFGPAYFEAKPPLGFGRRRGLTPVTNHRPRALAVGDIDNDGKEEAVFADGGILVVHQSGGPNYTIATTGARFELLQMVDHNGDGLLDVAAFDGAGNQLGIIEQQLDNSFLVLPGLLPTAGTVLDMEWVDIDRDGLVDVFYTDANGLNLRLGSRAPADPPIVIQAGVEYITTADFDGDTVTDVFGSLATGGGRFYLQYAGGAFNQSILDPSITGNAGAVESCDADNDGDVDLIYARKADPGSIYRNDSAGVLNFALETSVGSGTDVFSDIICADLNNDGFNDLWFSPKNISSSGYYWTSDLGAFTAVNQRVFSSDAIGAIEPGDVDGDGDIDIVESSPVVNEERAWRENATITFDLLHETPSVPRIEVDGLQRSSNARSTRFFESLYVPIRIRLYDHNRQVIPQITLEYSVRGGANWKPLTVRDPEKLLKIPVVNGSATVQVEWVLPSGGPTDHISSDDVRVRAIVQQPIPKIHAGQFPTRPVATVSGRIAIDDPCAGHGCSPDLCFGGSCYTGCTVPSDCPIMGEVCYRRQGTCGTNGIACNVDSECTPDLCTFNDFGRCDTDGDPNTSLNCPLGMVEYGGSCFDPCAGDEDCTPPQVCFNFVCQADACAGVHCPLGEVCYQGSCFDTTCADDGDCTPPQLCFNNHCATDACDGVVCPLGQVCFEGACYDSCAMATCSSGSCFNDVCYDPTDPCDGVVCGTSETCVGGICAISCMSDAQCDVYNVAVDGTPLDCDGIGTDDPDCLLCFNGRCRPSVDPCDSVFCPLGEVCHEGSCFTTCTSDASCGLDACYDDAATPEAPICLNSTDPCASVSCPDEYVCHEGSCYLSCGSQRSCMADAECPPDETCQGGYCLRCDPESEECFQSYCAPTACDSVFCPLGQVCYAGSCFDTCLTASCSTGGDLCFDGRCSVEDCADVICPLGEVCVGGTCFDPCTEQSDCGGSDWFFQDVTVDSRLSVPGNKEGGAAWADYDQDGDLDVFVNTADGIINSRIFRNNGDATFADVTFLAGISNWVGKVNADRSAIWGDYNGDGFIDLARNSGRRVEIFENKGPMGSPPWGLGSGADGEPTQEFRSWPLGGTFNTEGMAWIDYDGDADLDLMVNSQTDIVMLENVAGSLTQTTLPSTLGLLTGAAASDYCLAADLDVDGDVDITCRVDGDAGTSRTADIWFNVGGTFVPITTADLAADNANKGGAAACDLTNNGLFDIVWTDGTEMFILEQQAAGTFVKSKQLEISSSTVLPKDIDGVDCGDVDNDGDVDILLGGASRAYLFINDSTGGVMLFRNATDKGLVSTDDIESVNFVDYDSDGDLDAFLNQDTGTRLFRNTLGGDNRIRIRIAYDLGGRLRDAIGATVTIRDPDGDMLGVREVNGGKGHGSQSRLWVHYGLANGRQVPYELDVRFPSGERVRRCVLPTAFATPDILIRNTDTNDLTACADPDWTSRVIRYAEPETCWEPEIAPDGTVIRPARCSRDNCEGIQCPGSEICYEGGCFDFCTDDLECDPGSICYNNRCVDSEEPYCDGIVCPLGDICYRGECFSACSTDVDCPTGDFCYLGRCAPEDCTGIASLCEGDEVCYRGTCFEDCSADPSVCPADESCYEGRCADNGCAALPDNYDADHPFRKFGRRLASSQYSTPWHWPRPIVSAAPDFDAFVNVVGGIETNEVPARGRARVAMVLDPSLSDAQNPSGQYVLYLTQGFDSGAGLQQPTVGQYNIRVRKNDEVTKVLWDNQGEAYHAQSDLGEDFHVVKVTSGLDETAGIAIGPFPSREAVDWSITIQAALGGAVKDWELYNPDTGRGFVLRQDEPLKIRSVPLSPDHYITPSSGMPCDVDPAIAQGMCGLGTSTCKQDGSLTCDQTIIRWPYELCDGRDNNCNGTVDENVRFVVSDWRQAAGGWSFFVTNDTLGDIHSFMNFKPRATDDRRGSTSVTGYGGVAIQGNKKSLTTMHRDVRTGLLAMPLVHGQYMSGAVATGYGQDDIYMTLGLDYTHPDNTFIAFHDDMLPIRTNDEIPDSYDAATRTVGLDWRLAKPTNDERESDSVAVRPLVRPWDRNPQVTFSLEFEGTLGGTNSESAPSQLEWRLYQPRLAEATLRRADDLSVRTTLRPSLTSVCSASNTSPSGCTLGRYQCVRGRVYCSSATDGACDLCFDSDGDGYERYDAATCPDGTDCNDSNPLVYPGATEICDGVDNDCDGETDVTVNGAVAFGETLSCINGDDRCGPAECDFAFSCVCPNGPEDPSDPSSGPCFCGASLDEDDAPATPVDESVSPGLDSQSSSKSIGSSPGAGGCSTPGDSLPNPLWFGLLGLIFIRTRRRR